MRKPSNLKPGVKTDASLSSKHSPPANKPNVRNVIGNVDESQDGSHRPMSTSPSITVATSAVPKLANLNSRDDLCHQP